MTFIVSTCLTGDLGPLNRRRGTRPKPLIWRGIRAKKPKEATSERR